MTPLSSRTEQNQQGSRAVCHRGRISDLRCGTVISTTYRPVYDGACDGSQCFNTFVYVNRRTEKGDSGGPWFAGESAFGVNMARGDAHSVYTPIRASDFNAMGIGLLYAP